MRYICRECAFSDKIREAFVQSTMEIVCVNHLLKICTLPASTSCVINSS